MRDTVQWHKAQIDILENDKTKLMSQLNESLDYKKKYLTLVQHIIRKSIKHTNET